MSNKINQSTVKHIADLAQIPISDNESKQLTTAFLETLKVVDELQEIDTSLVEPTHQVTGLKNVLRDDVVIKEQMFSQEEALSNAKNTHRGFFVVPKVLEK